MKIRQIGIFLTAILCMVLGAGLYIMFRQETIFVNLLNISVLSCNLRPTYLILYCLPDGLWFLALLIIQYSLFQRRNKISKVLLCFAVALPFVLECMQALGWFWGTFDWYDILTYCVTLIIFIICVRNPFFSLAHK